MNHKIACRVEIDIVVCRVSGALPSAIVDNNLAASVAQNALDAFREPGRRKHHLADIGAVEVQAGRGARLHVQHVKLDDARSAGQHPHAVGGPPAR